MLHGGGHLAICKCLIPQGIYRARIELSGHSVSDQWAWDILSHNASRKLGAVRGALLECWDSNAGESGDEMRHLNFSRSAESRRQRHPGHRCHQFPRVVMLRMEQNSFRGS